MIHTSLQARKLATLDSQPPTPGHTVLHLLQTRGMDLAGCGRNSWLALPEHEVLGVGCVEEEGDPTQECVVKIVGQNKVAPSL